MVIIFFTWKYSSSFFALIPAVLAHLKIKPKGIKAIQCNEEQQAQ